MDSSFTNTVSFDDLFKTTFPEANHFKNFSDDCKHLIEVRLQQHAPRGAIIPTTSQTLPEMKYVESYSGQLQSILKDIVDDIAVKSVSGTVSKSDKEFAEELCDAKWTNDLK